MFDDFPVTKGWLIGIVVALGHGRGLERLRLDKEVEFTLIVGRRGLSIAHESDGLKLLSPPRERIKSLGPLGLRVRSWDLVPNERGLHERSIHNSTVMTNDNNLHSGSSILNLGSLMGMNRTITLSAKSTTDSHKTKTDTRISAINLDDRNTSIGYCT